MDVLRNMSKMTFKNLELELEISAHLHRCTTVSSSYHVNAVLYTALTAVHTH